LSLLTLAVLIGIIALVIGLLLGTIQVVRPLPRAGAANALLALVACAAICVGTLGGSLLGTLGTRAIVAALLGGVISIIAGIAIFAVERRGEGFDPGHSIGLLCAGTGIFALVCAVILPVLPSQFTLPAPTLIPTSTASALRTALPTRTPRITGTVTSIPTLTTTPTQVPSLTVTPTLGVPDLPTSILPSETITPTLVPCTVTVNRNVNLRRGASAETELMTTVPFDTVLNVTQRSQDKMWWRVVYNGQVGWVNSIFVTPDAACRQVPTATTP
jgi:hypothetical protein